MLHLVQTDRSYGPETIAVMAAAFERVCQSISKRMNGSDDVKKILALIILKHVDRGERNAEQLAEIAFREWTGTDRSVIGDPWHVSSLASPPDQRKETHAMLIRPAGGRCSKSPL